MVFVELRKSSYLDESKIDEWSLLDQIVYLMNYALDENKRYIINLLKKKTEVLRYMLDKQEIFEEGTMEDLARIKMYFDRLERLAFEKELQEREKKGIQQGIQQGLLEVAYRLLESGMCIEQVALFTNVSIEELELMMCKKEL